MNAWIAVFLLACAAVNAAEAQEVRLSGAAGFGARAVRGERTPVTVEIENRGPDRDVLLAIVWAAPGPAQRGTPTFASLADRRGPAHHLPVTLPARTRKSISAVLVVPDAENVSVWAFALADGGKTIATQELLTRPVPRSSRLVAVVGSDRPDGLDLPGVETAWVRPEHLPEDAKGYSGLEALLWLDGRPSDVRSQAQLDALRTWVSSGGRLLVARAHTVGLENSAVAELLPVAFKGGRDVDALASLATLPGAKSAPDGKAALLGSTVLRGRVRLKEGALPLVVEAPQDAGRVTFIAFDPARAPFAGWADAKVFWAWLLSLPLVLPPDSGDYETPPRLLGSVSLAQAAASFPDVAPPALGALFLLIVLYLFAVGPVDYFVLRAFKRLELTWITFPAYVLGFTLLILVIGGAFMSRAALQREVAVADHYADSDFCRRRALGALLAPGDSTFAFSAAEPVSSNFLTRGVAPDYSEELTGITIAHGSPDRARDWTLRRGSTGLLLADRSSTERPPLAYSFDREGGAQRRISLDSREEFQGAILVTPEGAFLVGTIPRGESRSDARRIADSPRAYAATLGGLPPPVSDRRGRFDPYGDRPGSISEEALNQRASTLLSVLSFIDPAPHVNVEPLTGFARDLNASAWLEAGGSVLVAFRRSDETLIALDPRPTQRTSLVMTRIFKGPPK